MTEEEGKKLVRDAIASGVFNDLGSGSNVDLCVIRKGSVDYLRNYELANKKGERQLDYRFKKGTSAVLPESWLIPPLDHVRCQCDHQGDKGLLFLGFAAQCWAAARSCTWNP